MLRRLGDVNQTLPPAIYEEGGDYVLNVSLTANQVANRQPVQIDPDSDFELHGIVGSSTSTYTLTIRHYNGRAMQSAQVKNTNLVGTPSAPSPLLVPSVYPAGSVLSVDLTDTSGAGNDVQLIFKGVRRYRSR